MQDWWQGLNSKEQKLVGFGSIFVVIILFIMLVWVPLNDSIEKSKLQLKKQQDLAVWINENLATYKQVKRSGGTKKATGSLTSIVNTSAKSLKITLARIQPQGDDLQVWVDEVSFNVFLSWLEDLTNKKGLKIVAADIALGSSPGTVKVRRLQLTKA
ncbi:type II secretion system protein GspM [Thalassotalea crassostreae]|uniref:type II secretion system protein GspM n=1 Tax=Thalassotalea crassostreae TaxID=1763536 RepID=UPI000838F5E3|nr:type II secretion system protein M [Thalassotalea crassostreae]